MIFYEWARALNKKRKQKAKEQAGRYLDPVRRIERVAPMGEKLVAMTFDDGPTNVPPNPGDTDRPLTAVLMDIMAQFGAHGTFDVIGSTAENYPDKVGKPDYFTWGGMRFDHYPDFGKDELAGALTCDELMKRLLAEGHELSNHGYRHVIFGPMRVVYGSRAHLQTMDEVVSDLLRLHELVEQKYDYTLRLSRPPHYIDKIPDGYSSYDAYKRLGYLYMASSFDGGGWIAGSGDYAADVRKMIEPLERALDANDNALNGQIIFQKDGFNMSRCTPVADALGPQLELLQQYGYRVVTVGELLRRSMFEDYGEGDTNFDWARRLANHGYCVGYRNNTFQPRRFVTWGELAVMTADPAIFRVDYGSRAANETYRQALTGNPKAANLAGREQDTVGAAEFLRWCEQWGAAPEAVDFADSNKLTRCEILPGVAAVNGL